MIATKDTEAKLTRVELRGVTYTDDGDAHHQARVNFEMALSKDLMAALPDGVNDAAKDLQKASKARADEEGQNSVKVTFKLDMAPANYEAILGKRTWKGLATVGPSPYVAVVDGVVKLGWKADFSDLTTEAVTAMACMVAQDDVALDIVSSQNEIPFAD